MLGRGKGSRGFCKKEGRQDKRRQKPKQARTRQLARQVPLETRVLMTRRRASAGSAMLMSPALETTGVQVARRYLHLVSYNRE